jgi:hypothetical protein
MRDKDLILQVKHVRQSLKYFVIASPSGRSDPSLLDPTFALDCRVAALLLKNYNDSLVVTRACEAVHGCPVYCVDCFTANSAVRNDGIWGLLKNFNVLSRFVAAQRGELLAMTVRLLFLASWPQSSVGCS